MIVVNGNAKAGIHVLTVCVELLGFPSWHEPREGHCMLGHWPVQKPPPEDQKHVHIIRNPRDMLVSWVRFKYPEVSPGYLIAATKSYYDGLPIYDEFFGYWPWLDDAAVLSIRFEDLVDNDGIAIPEIAKYLGVELPEPAEKIFERVKKAPTRTKTNNRSHWPNYWSNSVEDAWQIARGPEIEAMFSYG